MRYQVVKSSDFSTTDLKMWRDYIRKRRSDWPRLFRVFVLFSSGILRELPKKSRIRHEGDKKAFPFQFEKTPVSSTVRANFSDSKINFR